MLGLVAPTLVALAAALALGGSPRGWAKAYVWGWPVILGVFAVELVVYNPPVNQQAWAIDVGPWVWLATKVVLLVILARNGLPSRGLVCWPWLVATFGMGLNTLAIALNGGHMPQSPEAAYTVWGASHVDPSRLQNIAAMRPETLLPWLGDVLPEPAWLPRPNVVSPGDVALALGVAAWAFGATTPSNTRLTRCGKRIVARIAAPIHGAARTTRRYST